MLTRSQRADLERALAGLAEARAFTTYGALAAEIGLEGAGRIARLTSTLEALMEEDMAADRPLRAALVLSRATGGLPARGFFDKARDLGHDLTDPQRFHTAQIARLFSVSSPN